MILLAVLLLLGIDSGDVLNATINQSNVYQENIHEGSSVELNYWALTEIFYSNCAVQKHIAQTDLSVTNQRLFSFYTNGSCLNPDSYDQDDKIDLLLKIAKQYKYFNLFAFYLTQVEEEVALKSLQILEDEKWELSEKEKLILRSLAEKREVNTQLISLDNNLLIHLGVLTSSERSKYLTNKYLSDAVNVWSVHADKLSNISNLEHSVLVANLFSAAFLLYDDNTIIEYSNLFLETNYFPSSYFKLLRYNAIEFSNYIFGNYDKSLEIQRNYSLPLAEHLNLKEEKNKILSRHGAYLFTLGKYYESQKINLQLLQSSDITNNYTILNNLSVDYLKLGFKNKYLSLQLDALNQNISNYKSLLNIYRNLFIYYTSVKDINSALIYIEKAKAVAIEHDDNAELANINAYIGTFYWNTYKDHEKSLHYFEIAEEVLSAENNYEAYRDLLLGKSGIYIKIGDYAAAKETLDHLKELTLSKSDTRAYLHTEILLASYHLKINNLEQAEKNINEILMHSLDALDFEILTKFFTIKAEYLFKTQQRREAITELTPVIDQIINRTKNSTDSQSGFWTIEDEYLDAFQLMVQIYRDSGEPQKALVLLDQLKTINDAYLYNNPLVKATKLSETELAEERRLNQEIQDLRKNYLNSNQKERFELKIEIDRLTAKREEILNRANLNKEVKMPPVWAIQRMLGPDELVLHFTELGAQLYVSHITSNRIDIKSYELNNNEILHLTEVADQIANGSTNLHELYNIYESLELDQIPGAIKKITVIPDNYLYRIPLEILPTSMPESSISYGSTRYLIEDYHFRYITSLQEFGKNRRNISLDTAVDFSVFAISEFDNFDFVNLPALPFAATEANDIVNELQFFDEKKVYKEAEATKKEFIDATGNSKIVHVATHSEISEQNPLFSTIYLNGHGSEELESNQALYAYELFDTQINSDLIMLNSCSSGSGDYMQGTGIMGISRALRYAGAKSLALNLWSVNDKVASEFATVFYAYINKGFSKSEAFRQAKLDQLSTGNANPHFWGAYMMIGNPAPLIDKNEHSVIFYSGLFAMVLILGYTTRKAIS